MTRPPITYPVSLADLVDITYPVSLADLVDIADAARDLDESRQFHVDQPAEQQRLAARVERLHAIVERAAAHDAILIYGQAEESDHAPQHP